MSSDDLFDDPFIDPHYLPHALVDKNQILLYEGLTEVFPGPNVTTGEAIRDHFG